jgi:hypothetical protein
MKHIAIFSLLFSVLLFGGCKDDPVIGCLDPNASNYNPLAEEDSGACTYLGCTDPDASNFDAMATDDSGNCIYPGCLDEDGDNYDPKFNEDDGSCTYFNLYVAEYDGNFDCLGTFAGLLDEASASITQKPGDENTDEITVIVSNPATDITLLLDGVITKDEAVIDTYIQNFEYTLVVGEITIEGPFEVFVNGTLTRTDDNTLAGPITIRIDKTELALSVSDTCNYTATRN